MVPVATTRPPCSRVSVHEPGGGRAGTSYHSDCGPSSASWEETPVCSVIGATPIPFATSLVISASVNGRPAEAISALPGTVLNTDWYAASG